MVALFNLNSILWNDFPQFREERKIVHTCKWKWTCSNYFQEHLVFLLLKFRYVKFIWYFGMWNSFDNYLAIITVSILHDVKCISIVTEQGASKGWFGEVWRPDVLMRFRTTCYARKLWNWILSPQYSERLIRGITKNFLKSSIFHLTEPTFWPEYSNSCALHNRGSHFWNKQSQWPGLVRIWRKDRPQSGKNAMSLQPKFNIRNLFSVRNASFSSLMLWSSYRIKTSGDMVWIHSFLSIILSSI